MSDWQNYRVGDHISPLSGFPFSSSYFSGEEGFPLIRIRDLLEGKTDLKYTGKYEITYVVRKDDLLIGMDGDFHLVKWKGKDALLNQRILKLIENRNSDLCLDFLFYWLNPFLIEVNEKTAATTVKHLSTYDVVNAIVNAPAYAEQQKIAKILSTVDNLIEKTQTLIDKYTAIKQGMMADLFTRGIDMTAGDHQNPKGGKLRPSVEDAPDLYKQTELGWVPKEWEIVDLADACRSDITYGIVQAGPNVDGGIPYIRTGDMSGDSLHKEKLMCTSDEIAASFRRSRVETGDIVCAIRATVGKVLKVPTELDGANLTQGTARIAPKDCVGSDYLLWHLRSGKITKQYAEVIKGTTFMEITLAQLRLIKILLPPFPEQKRIAEKLVKLDELINVEKENLSKTKLKKKGLMQDLLTGKVRVN